MGILVGLYTHLPNYTSNIHGQIMLKTKKVYLPDTY